MAPSFRLTSETKYQLLLQISQKLRDTLDLDEILNHLLDSVHTVLGYDAAGIFVLNRDLPQLHSRQPRALIAGVARRGFPAGREDRDRMLMLGEGITGHVIRTAQPVIAPDVRLDPRYISGRPSSRSQITVPLLRAGRAIGALDLESDRLAAFDENDLEVLQFFADAAAISVEKATLHRQLMEQQELQSQLLTASAVQARLLPHEAPHIPGWDIAGICLPAFDIGGDYFDFIPLADGRLGIAIADVSGDGVPAALVMSAFRALLRTQEGLQTDPARHLTAVNGMLRDFGGENDFVTAAYCMLDPATGLLDYTICGSPELVLCRRDGGVELLGNQGPALNLFTDFNYVTNATTIAPGDLLALFTDGVIELSDSEGQMFEIPRLIEVLRGAGGSSASGVIERVCEASREFSGLERFPDDFTLVVLRRV